jgi:hypothetical protein
MFSGQCGRVFLRDEIIAEAVESQKYGEIIRRTRAQKYNTLNE